MTAIAEPPVAAARSGTRQALRPADGLELHGEMHGSGYKDGVALVRRADGQMVQLGPLMYALLECVDGRRGPAELAEAMSERLGRSVEPEHVAALAQKLAAQGLLAGTEGNAPAQSNPLLALRWKYLITDPEATRRITAPFTGFFRPWIVLPVLAAFFAVVWFVVIHKGVASATAQAFQNPELLLLVFLLAIGSAGFHELGHAAACRYGGATPGGMGFGIYMVWPAFYTDVTDSYRLPKRDRLRVDLGGLYFNALVAVATLIAWTAVDVDALLLLVALQLFQMVKQLSPVIRADGYHILSDITGVPDLYQHMGPTLKRLVPGRRDEPSALTGRARFLATAWVLIVVPILLALTLSVILLLPRLLATAWASGQNLATGLANDAGDGDVVGATLAFLRLIALALPVLGVVLMAQKIVRTLAAKTSAWSQGRPRRRAVLALAGSALAGVLLWAWWPSGQYRPVRASDRGTLVDAGRVVAAPASAVRPPAQQTAELEPGRHLAVALIPVGGATEQRPAAFVIKGDGDQKPVVVTTPSAADPTGGSTPAATAPEGETPPPATTTAPQPAASSSTTGDPVPATAFPFKLPDKPGPNGTQALAVNTKDGTVKYVVAYTVVTVHDGAAVDHTNEAYAFASCNACTTVAVSFQIVLIVGTSNLIAPINVAGALNVNCPECITTAIANQIVITLSAEPSEELLARLNDELDDLEDLDTLIPNGSPAEVAAEVEEIEQQIHEELESSGLMTNPPSEPETGASTTPTQTTPTQTEPSGTQTTTEPSTTTETGTETTGTETTPTQTESTETQTTTEPSTTTTEPSTTDTTTTSTSTTTAP